MNKTKNIVLYYLILIIAIALIFYFRFMFFNNDVLTGNEIDKKLEDNLISEPARTEAQEEVLTGETLEEELIEKEAGSIKYKISPKMESEEDGKKIILYDVVTPNITDENLNILTENIIQDLLNKEEAEKVVLFFHENENLLGVRFKAKATWVPDKISIELVK